MPICICICANELWNFMQPAAATPELPSDRLPGGGSDAAAASTPASDLGPTDTMATTATTRSTHSGSAVHAAEPRSLTDDSFPPTLVLGTSIVMASAAMEAYLEPTQGKQYRVRGANGTETQYLDCEFVRANLRALLEVTVKSATGFSGVDVRLTSCAPLPDCCVVCRQPYEPWCRHANTQSKPCCIASTFCPTAVHEWIDLDHAVPTLCMSTDAHACCLTCSHDGNCSAHTCTASGVGTTPT